MLGVRLNGGVRGLLAMPKGVACERLIDADSQGIIKPDPALGAARVAFGGERDADADADSGAVAVAFSLPPGSYALEAMRELLKQ